MLACPSACCHLTCCRPVGSRCLPSSLPQGKNLEWELEVLQQRFGAVQAERDELKQRLEASVHEVQQKTGEHEAGLGQAGCSPLLGLHCF